MLIMSRVISELLRASEPQFSQTISAFEQAAGYPGADVRLTADIEQKILLK